MSEPSRLGAWARRRLVGPLAAQLRQGVTPEKIALSLATGAVISCCPLLGATTAICALAAIVLRLNHVAIQVVNYAAAPLQLALILPFWRLGAAMFGSEPVPLSPDRIAALFRADFWGATARYGVTALRGALVWALIAVPAVLALDRVFRAVLRRVWKQGPP